MHPNLETEIKERLAAVRAANENPEAVPHPKATAEFIRQSLKDAGIMTAGGRFRTLVQER